MTRAITSCKSRFTPTQRKISFLFDPLCGVNEKDLNDTIYIRKIEVWHYRARNCSSSVELVREDSRYGENEEREFYDFAVCREG
jgi:hypothetical protein